MITKKMVLGKLKKVVDPEVDVNIVDMGLIYEVEIQKPIRQAQGGQVQAFGSEAQARRDDKGRVNVNIKMTLTSPGCPLSMVFDAWVRDAVKKIKGVKRVTINLVWEPAWTPERMTDEAKEKAGLI